MLRVFTILICLIMFPAMAGATPPRVFTSDDRIVAATQTHLYVLRELQDNQGSHYSTLIDQHLVEIDLDSHAASRSWLLRSLWENRITPEDFVSPGKVVEHQRDTVDMFAILRETGAVPQSARIAEGSDLLLTDGSLMHEKAGIVASRNVMVGAARAQLLPLMASYPRTGKASEYKAGENMEVYDLSNASNWHCELLPIQLTVFRAKDRLRIVKIGCDDDFETGAWTFHMALPDKNWE